MNTRKWIEPLLIMILLPALTVIAANLLFALYHAGWVIYSIIGLIIIMVIVAGTGNALKALSESVDGKQRYRYGSSSQSASTQRSTAKFEQIQPYKGRATGWRGKIWMILTVAVSTTVVATVLYFIGSWQWIIRHNLLFSFLVVLIIAQSAMRKKVFETSSWKRLSDNWLKINGYSGMSIGGFGMVYSNESLNKNLLAITTDAQLVDIKTLISVYILSILLFGAGMLVTTIGKTKAVDEDSNEPFFWFVPAFILVWVAAVGLYTLFFDAILMTLHAHLSM